MTNVVLFSGGLASYCAALRVSDPYCVFTDTKTEDEDLYRFLDDVDRTHLDWRLLRLQEGRDVWQVFKDRRMIGNTRIDPCSETLKRNLVRRWIEKHFQPDECIVVMGLDWTETHRIERMASRWHPYRVDCPLAEPPYLSKQDMANICADHGIAPPRLYAMGFPHNNCGGFCIKAGHAHFAHLLRTMPDRYAYHEAKEQELRDYLGKDVAILRDRGGGVTTPLTLRALRERVESDEGSCQLDMFDWGGCGCFDES